MGVRVRRSGDTAGGRILIRRCAPPSPGGRRKSKRLQYEHIAQTLKHWKLFLTPNTQGLLQFATRLHDIRNAALRDRTRMRIPSSWPFDTRRCSLYSPLPPGEGLGVRVRRSGNTAGRRTLIRRCAPPSPGGRRKALLRGRSVVVTLPKKLRYQAANDPRLGQPQTLGLGQRLLQQGVNLRAILRPAALRQRVRQIRAPHPQ